MNNGEDAFKSNLMDQINFDIFGRYIIWKWMAILKMVFNLLSLFWFVYISDDGILKSVNDNCEFNALCIWNILKLHDSWLALAWAIS